VIFMYVTSPKISNFGMIPKLNAYEGFAVCV
ncbi:hypothetical protein CCACVL1_28704, partial [Corchorus capsularis]